jgi:hypothetical protein
MEWGCTELGYLEGFNNLGMKRVSSLVQIHAPTSSIEVDPTFIEFDEDNEMQNNISHNSDDSSNGQSSTLAGNLRTPRRNDHDNNTMIHWNIAIRGQIIALKPREVMFDDDLGEDHVGLFILYCLDDILES